MTTCFNSPVAKIWIDENIPCAFFTMFEKIDDDELKVLFEVERKAINQIKVNAEVVYSIIDLSNCSISTQELIIKKAIEAIEKKPFPGFTYLLFVTNRETPISSKVPNMWIEIFRTFESALSKVNFFRTSGHKNDWAKSRKPIQIMLFLIYCGQKLLDFVGFRL